MSRKILREYYEFGAGDGDRTRIACLEGRYSTIELHPRLLINSFYPANNSSVQSNTETCVPTATNCKMGRPIRQVTSFLKGLPETTINLNLLKLLYWNPRHPRPIGQCFLLGRIRIEMNANCKIPNGNLTYLFKPLN